MNYKHHEVKIESSPNISGNYLHELLCKAICERDIEALKELSDNITDIKVTRTVSVNQDNNEPGSIL